MHEARLMRDLMRRIAETAAREGGGRVVRVDVWLGALSHFSPGHFAEHFVDASHGTIAEGADTVCEMSEDVNHPDAQGVRLLSVALE
jgi:hydrogenase nickel incorporation protein HypA/HybF